MKTRLNKRGKQFVENITLTLQIIISIMIVLLTVYLLDLKILTTAGEEISFKTEINKMMTE